MQHDFCILCSSLFYTLKSVLSSRVCVMHEPFVKVICAPMHLGSASEEIVPQIRCLLEGLRAPCEKY